MNFMSLLLSCREIYDKIYDGLDEKTKTKLTGGCWKLGVQRCVREDLPDEPFDCSTVDVAFTRAEVDIQAFHSFLSTHCTLPGPQGRGRASTGSCSWLSPPVLVTKYG